MTKEQANQVITELVGWSAPRIEDVGYGDYIITAVDPADNRRKRYNPKTGFFN